ncbi:MAG: glutamate 5-kinase, partial [Desulfohalobiaceae bacterium]
MDSWQEKSNIQEYRHKRWKILSSSRLIVLKVGSAVLTSGQGLDLRVLNRLADEIAALHDQGKEFIVVSSGAVAAGKRFLGLQHQELSLPEKQAAAAIGQSRLMHSYDEAFERYNKTTAQILLTRDDLRSRHRFLNARNTFSTLLQSNIIPIVNENDTVVVQELKFGDNDFLATLILNLVQAELFINLTSAEGVFSANPELNNSAKKMDYLPNIRELDLESTCEGKTSSGSGGMYSKLLAASRASQLGVPTLIVSGRTPHVLERIFDSEELGTWIMPARKTIPQKKFWLAYNLDPVGSLYLDQGAADALLMRGKSLLPAGIRGVCGEFSSGDLVRLMGPDHKQLGVGLTNFDSLELHKIAGMKTSELEATLGHTVYSQAVVHRDNLLLD